MLALAGTVAVAGATAGLVATFAVAGGSRQAIPCPRVSWEHSINAPVDEVLRAARRLVPAFYKNLESQGHPAWPHFKVDGLVSPDWGYSPGGPGFQKFGEHLCGKTIARQSWVVYLAFPECQLPCTWDAALMAYTRKGWVIWASRAYGRSPS